MTTEHSPGRIVPWRPLDGIPDRLNLQAVHDDCEGLRFLLKGERAEDLTLRIAFEVPIGYRCINESFRLRAWRSLQSMGSHPTLLVLEDSAWLQWLKEEALGVLDATALVHYALYTPEDCVDVASEVPPNVEWLG